MHGEAKQYAICTEDSPEDHSSGKPTLYALDIVIKDIYELESTY